MSVHGSALYEVDKNMGKLSFGKGKLSIGLKEYYQEIARAIPCTGREKRQYLSELKKRLYGMEAEGTVDDYDTARLLWGTKDEIVEAWEECLEIEEYIELHNPNRWKKLLAYAVTAATVVLLVVLGGYYLMNYGINDFIVRSEPTAPVETPVEDETPAETEDENTAPAETDTGGDEESQVYYIG